MAIDSASLSLSALAERACKTVGEMETLIPLSLLSKTKYGVDIGNI